MLFPPLLDPNSSPTAPTFLFLKSRSRQWDGLPFVRGNRTSVLAPQ
jgi:hypothetical protein